MAVSTSVTNEGAAPEPSEPQIEPELQLPTGVELERLASGEERVQVRYPVGSRALAALPRITLFACGVFALAQAWRHHVFVAFWIFGLPFLRWLGGPTRGSLLIGTNQLEVEGARLFGGSLIIPRARIADIEVTRGNVLQLFQRAITVRLLDEQSRRLLVGLSAAQAEFVSGGLRRWLAGS
jgi:hypothetical protein